MSCIWVSARDCSRQELFHLTELLKKDQDMQIIFSSELPGPGTKSNVTDERIAELLVRLGIRPNLKGYQYLRTALRICMKDRDELDGITKRLYPAVARKHGTTAGKVEHAIRHAIQTAWMKGDGKTQKAVFGYRFEEGKRPTNSEFIVRMLEYMEKMSRPLLS